MMCMISLEDSNKVLSALFLLTSVDFSLLPCGFTQVIWAPAALWMSEQVTCPEKPLEVKKRSNEALNNIKNPPTPAYQGERAQRRLAKNNIHQHRSKVDVQREAPSCKALSIWRCEKWAPKLQNHVFLKVLDAMFAVHVKATPMCEMGPKAVKSSLCFKFWTQRLTLKITPMQVQKRCPWARQAMLFPCCGGGVLGKPFRLAVEVHRKATSRCEMGPKAAKSCLFKGSRRNVCRACQSHSEVRNGPQSCKNHLFL